MKLPNINKTQVEQKRFLVFPEHTQLVDVLGTLKGAFNS